MLVGGNIMNLIDKFESMPFQNVSTFNSIFKTTPILNVDDNLNVEVCELSNDNSRKIIVGDKIIFMDLTQRKNMDFEKKKVIKKKTDFKKINKVIKELPKLYKTLKPTEFIIYSAIKELSEIHGVEELSRQLSVSSKTILANLPRLIELNLVKKEYVTCKNGSFNKLSIV
jgi:predicted transcriptional regulator